MIRQITDPSEKALVSRAVLEALRDWFEVDESREYYIRESRNWPFFAAFDKAMLNSSRVLYFFWYGICLSF